jgi:ABC-type uncharacterized transport system auxiliary subunit
VETWGPVWHPNDPRRDDPDDESVSADTLLDLFLQDVTRVDEAAMEFTADLVEPLNEAVIKACRSARRTDQIDDTSAAAIGHAYYAAVHAVLRQQAEKEAT